MEEEKKDVEIKNEVTENESEETQKNSEMSLKGVEDPFKSLPMRELISAPLIAANEAQQQLAASFLDYYNKIAFTEDGQTRCLEFDLERPIQTQDSIGKQAIHIKAPFLGMVPLPSLMIDDTNVDFQMEVTEASPSMTEEKPEVSSNSIGQWFKFDVSMKGKVESSREHTSSTDKTPKYHVSASTSQQPPTEGLSKLKDLMESCLEPIDPEKKDEEQ